MRARLLLAVLILLPLSVLAAAAKKPTMEQVASKLSCYCGTCPHLVVTKCGCGTAEQIKKDVQAMIDQGMTEEQIIQSYVDKYGQTVLAAPPGKGFSLTAWAAPFLAFAFGGFLLFTFLRRQQKEEPEKTPSEPAPGAPSAEDDEYRKRLERELEQRK